MQPYMTAAQVIYDCDEIAALNVAHALSALHSFRRRCPEKYDEYRKQIKGLYTKTPPQPSEPDQGETTC